MRRKQTETFVRVVFLCEGQDATHSSRTSSQAGRSSLVCAASLGSTKLLEGSSAACQRWRRPALGGPRVS